jgi:hypothetical protein
MRNAGLTPIDSVKAINDAVRVSTRIERRVKKLILASYG